MIEKYIKQFIEDGEICLKIKVRANSHKTEIKKIMDDGAIKIDVADPPEKNKANQELIIFLADNFSVDKNNIEIISGASDKIKLIKIWKKNKK